jgi:hypothetical protein
MKFIRMYETLSSGFRSATRKPECFPVLLPCRWINERIENYFEV